MAVIHTESFAWSDTLSDYTAYKGYNFISGTFAAGAWTGSTCFVIGSGAVHWGVGSQHRLLVGFRWQSTGGLGTIVCEAEAGGPNMTVQLSGTVLQLLDWDGSTVLATGTHTVTDGSWHYIEVDFNGAGSGTCTVHVDGAADISATSTVAAAQAISQIDWQTGNIQDVYVIDPATSPNTSFLADVHVECRRPNASGAATTWNPNGAPSNWQCVDDSPRPDGDTTYVATAGVGNRDSYALPSITEATPTAVPAVACYIIADKDNTAPRGVKPSIRSGSAALDGTELALANGTYNGARVIAQVDPSTSAAWTASGANAAKPGILLSS